MKKATRTFLNLRKDATFCVVESIEIANTKPNHCYQNACLLADSNEADLLVVSGWLIGDYLGDKGTAIIPHYWVLNEKTRKQFDPTPKNKKKRYAAIRICKRF